MNEELSLIPSVNRQALLSFILALLSLLSFCLGAIPVPFTALFCYPSSVLLSLAAVWAGWKALRQINGEDGRTLALIGLWAGGISLLFVVCAVTMMVLLWPYLLNLLQNAWQQLSGQ